MSSSTTKPQKEKPMDPTDDEMYKNLNLTDFLRHFVPQEAAVREEAERINEKKSLPFLDPNFPETMPKPATRAERRQLELKRRKADKKAKKLNDRVAALMHNPSALKKAIENPAVKQTAMRLQKQMEEKAAAEYEKAARAAALKR